MYGFHLEPAFHSPIKQWLKQLHNSVTELRVYYDTVLSLEAVPFMNLASVAAFSLLCENCTLHATSGYCTETQHGSTTVVYTGSQWKNLSILSSEWLWTGGCPARGAGSAAASYAESLPWQTEGRTVTQATYQNWLKCLSEPFQCYDSPHIWTVVLSLGHCVNLKIYKLEGI
jgi:hypothetical protein